MISLAVGPVATLTTMVLVGGIYADQPIYVGLGTGLVGYVIGSLASRPTPPQVLATWDRRLSDDAGRAVEAGAATP